MDIIIPTYGRAEKQETLRQLLAAGLHVTLVVQSREAHLYERYASNAGVTLHVLPDSIRTIAPTRGYILHNVGRDPVFCMVDDDLWFYKRRTDDPTKLRDILPWELRDAFNSLANVIESGDAAHAGFAAREGANRNTEDRLWNTRIMRVLAYDRQLVQALPAKFGDLPVMEDFHVALALLEQGHKNVILNEYAHNQAGGSAATGGCSHFRTPEVQAAAAMDLAKRHPPFVKTVTKVTKTAWGGGSRTDVVVSWKKAYASSQ